VVLVPLMALLLVALAVAPVGAAKKPSKLQLTSPAFANQADIPIGFTCDGASASPPQVWRHGP
jgi:phosphatidylethanolamine-binding protein (PEBP) family uncharacterized protein